MGKLHITYSKSAIGYNFRQKATIRALGFRRLYQTIEKDDTPVIRGMINAVNHLVTVEEVEEKTEPKKARSGKAEAKKPASKKEVSEAPAGGRAS